MLLNENIPQFFIFWVFTRSNVINLVTKVILIDKNYMLIISTIYLGQVEYISLIPLALPVDVEAALVDLEHALRLCVDAAVLGPPVKYCSLKQLRRYGDLPLKIYMLGHDSRLIVFVFSSHCSIIILLTM